jgi:hypothetical protein
LRALHPNERIYTFWKYFRNAFARDAGLRIDHLLLSRARAEVCAAGGNPIKRRCGVRPQAMISHKRSSEYRIVRSTSMRRAPIGNRTRYVVSTIFKTPLDA